MQETDTMTQDIAEERTAAILRLRKDAQKRRDESLRVGAEIGAAYVREAATLEILDELLSESFSLEGFRDQEDEAGVVAAWAIDRQESHRLSEDWMLGPDCAEFFWRGVLEGVREEWDRIKPSVYVD